VSTTLGHLRCDPALLAAAAGFLFDEAALLDGHEYEAWLELWCDEGVYWIPAGGEQSDPERHVSIIYDNVRRLGMRVKQLQTGYRHAQLPQSRTQHYITNVRAGADDSGTVYARSSYLIVETRFGELHHWPGRAEHELVPDDVGALRIRRKTVVFITTDEPVSTLGFLP
jgi:benzoate/toluate 1,2-dioxygenase subunit beta